MTHGPAPSLAVDEHRNSAIDPSQTLSRHIRVDIQLLRALAIVLVVLQHARIPYLPAGFLGVDIFFVISGFLMTGLIDEGLGNNRFTFTGFYARRVRRLFPAAYATLVVTALAAPVLLDSEEYREFLLQLAGSFTFVVNMVLWKQSEYFGTDAALKPLLHMWSLSIEEQFYLLLPLLMFCAKRKSLPLTMILVVLSGLLCVYFVQHAPSAAFYFLPTRAWELGFGVVTALLCRRSLLIARPMVAVRLICVAVVVLVPILASEAHHPGLPAALVCLATAALLIPGGDPGAAKTYLRPFTAIGNRSYSLYLVHWPVFAFANNIFITAVPAWLNVALVVFCLLLTELQYRFIEQPLRTFAFTRVSMGVLFLVPVATIGLSLSWAHGHADAGKALARAANVGLSPICDYGHAYTGDAACQTSATASTLVWGDSFAIALVPGIVATSPGGVVQATRTVCGPFLGLAPTNDELYPQSWAASCIDFNNAVLKHLAMNPQIRTVVLTSALAQYVPGAENRGWSSLVAAGSGFTRRPQKLGDLVDSLSRTVAAIHALGRQVVLFAPPPSDGLDSARCLDRVGSGVPTVSPQPDCSIDKARYQALRRPILDFLAQAKTREIAPIISLDAELCGPALCATQLGGVPLYRDMGHLSMPGAVLLGKRMDWGGMIKTAASGRLTSSRSQNLR